MQSFTVGLLSTVLVIAATSGMAQTASHRIDFEQFSDGDLLAAQLPGLTIANGIILTSGYSLNEIAFPPGSGQSVLSDNGGPISFVFANPVSSLTARFTHSESITITALDPNGSQVAKVTSAGSNARSLGSTGTLPNEVLTIGARGGFTKLMIAGNPLGSSMAIDDVLISPVQTAPIKLSPSSLQFTFVMGRAISAPQNVIANSTGNVAFTVFSDAAWLSSSLSQGTTPVPVSVSIDPSKLKAGYYNADLFFNTNGASTSLPVNLQVLDPPTFFAVPSSLVFSTVFGQPSPTPQSIFVGARSINFDFSAAAKDDWISVPSHGVTSTALTVTPDTSLLQPGTSQSAVVLSSADAVNSPLEIPITVQVEAPQPAITAVVNSASFRSGAVAPGSLVTIFGSNLSISTQAADLPLPLSLKNVSVTIHGQPAPLLYISPTQINFQLPFEATGDSVSLVLSSFGKTAGFNVPVTASAPGIFMRGTQAAARSLDQTINAPGAPVEVGSYLSVYMTGQGAVDPLIGTGVAAPPSPLSWSSNPAIVTLGGKPVEVQFSGLAPGFVGLLQVNIKVPDLPSGDYPVSMSMSGVLSNVATVSVVKP